MTNRYLFRGKDIHTGVWITGCYSWVSFPEGIPTHRIINNITFADVDPKTVGQWTGLNDKNSVKIFEGDIVQPFKNRAQGKQEYIYPIGEIYYNVDCFMVIFGGAENPIVLRNRPMKVIGNIHDIPELLTESNNE